MKKIVLLSYTLTLSALLSAQQNEGKVTYERTVQMHIQISDNDEMAPRLPKTITDRFELTFGNNQSIWKRIDDEGAIDEAGDNGGGMHIRIMAQGQNDIIFCDFSLGKEVEQKEIFDKKYIVTDSIKKLNWKLTGDTQTILNHVCQKAIAQKTGKRTEVNIDNGVMKKKEADDTTNIIAWFTTDIPVSAGPEYPGELPGLILALEMNKGSVVYKATAISEKADPADIKEPTKGKKVTPDEFKAEQQKLMDEMQRNNEGGGDRRVFRISN
ncbi:MAG TPA: GLPGLI family protein [Chitinophagaceae bacterium]|nr:GLPGLI family protein [Chitinophagaceae bacterium]